jgi:rhodanese-related sulfurtransferase
MTDRHALTIVLALAGAAAAALALVALAPGAEARSTATATPPSASREAAAPPPGIIDGRSARELVARGIRVVDVRTPAEYAAGHVPGAVNIPFDQIAARAAELGPTEEPVLLYCRTGRRSGIAAEELRKLGFTALYDFQSLSSWPGEVATGSR